MNLNVDKYDTDVGGIYRRMLDVISKDMSFKGYYLSLIDNAIYWQKIGVNDKGSEIFAEPVTIKCRWDIVQTDLETQDAIEIVSSTNAVYSDRILVIDSYLMLGGQDVLDALSPEERGHPKLLRNARSVKSQSTIAELGWEQHDYPANHQSDHLVIECRV